METREIVQAKIYGLKLNSVLERAEHYDIVAISGSEQALMNWYNSQKLAETERDETGYVRSFKEGPLRNYNPFEWCNLGQGVFTEWINIDELDQIKSRFRWID